MAKPSTLPRWATGATGVAATTAPTSGKQDDGWAVAEKPPAQTFNWFWNLVYLWCAYLNGLTGELLTWTVMQTYVGNVTYGIDATGAAGFPGVTSKGGGVNAHGLYGTGVGIGHGTVCEGGATGEGGRFVGGLSSGAGMHGIARPGTNSYGAQGEGSGNAAGVHGTAGPTGTGVQGVGGATSGSGGTFTGTAAGATGLLATGGSVSGKGALLTGTGTGAGVDARGGASGGTAVVGISAGGNGKGAELQGSGAGTGAEITSGSNVAAIPLIVTRGDGGNQNTAIRSDGHVHLNGADPAASGFGTATVTTTGITNKVTPGLACKAMGKVASGSGTPTVTFGVNVASVAVGSDPFTLEVTLASSFASSTNWFPQVNGPDSGGAFGYNVYANPSAANKFIIAAFKNDGNQEDLRTANFKFVFTCWGAQ